MAVFREGKVLTVESSDDLVTVTIDSGDSEFDAVGFPAMLGPLEVGDRVIVNTTGIALGLGTGNVGFVLWNLDGPGPAAWSERGAASAEPQGQIGHIVKLRYTPWQTEVLVAEEAGSPHHDVLVAAESIDGMPVVACGLHSQIAGVAAGIKAAAPRASVGYLMTDGAALPLMWSNLVRSLKDHDLLDVTCSAGHAFGGDLETVNVFSGLAALKHAARVDVAIVAMGPGIVGTGTALGFTGIEQGQVLDAAAALGGTGVACLRISFADARARHRGVSHHTLTALRLAARERCVVAVPVDAGEHVDDQLAAAGIAERHELEYADGAPGVALLKQTGIAPTSMGRTMDEDPILWTAAAAAGRAAAERL